MYSWGHASSHQKFGLDRFSRFKVYWIQTDGQQFSDLTVFIKSKNYF